MPTGIDVGPQAIRVATPAGTTAYENEFRRVDEADADGVVVESDDEVYAVAELGGTDDGGASADETDESGDGTGESMGRLFGGASEAPPGVRGGVADAVLDAVLGHAGSDDGLRYVVGPDGAEPLAAAATGSGVEATPVDPGMAVWYDAFDAPATGLGVAVAGERVVATLATGGVPVATATVPVDDEWYDLDDTTATGPENDWLARQYEALFADLGATLARTAPALGDPVPVAIGGPATPDETDGLAAALGVDLPFAVGAVTTVDDPAWALARGGLVAAESDDGVETPLPPFAVDVAFVGALADFGAATDTLEDGATLSATSGDAGVATTGSATATRDDSRHGGGPGAVVASADPASDGAAARAGDPAGPDALWRTVARTRADLTALDRRAASTARGVSDLVEHIEGEAGDDAAVESLRADVETLRERVPEDGFDDVEGNFTERLDELSASVDALEADIERLDEATATAESVATLGDEVDALEAAVADVEADTDKLRGVLAGLEEGTSVEAPEVEGVEALQADALQEEIDALESSVEDRVEDVWSAVDDIEGRLVDAEATADDVPDIESTVTSTRNAVADIESETATLRESVDDLRSTVESVRAEAADSAALRSVAADVDTLQGDLADLRREFEQTDRVDPATVEEIQTDLDGLRGTLISRADRLESLEESTENLRERIETVYQNSAKSEALASVETEVARVRETASTAMERTNEMTETVSNLDETVGDHDEQLGMLSTNVDNLAGSAVTRPEMESDIQNLAERFEELESDLRTEMEALRETTDQDADVEPVEEGGNELVVTLQTVAFVFLGVFGAVLAFLSNFPLVAGAFLVFSIMPAVLSWLVN
jgi:predicted  nucleic acid-binding Zn-ribbon protein